MTAEPPSPVDHPPARAGRREWAGLALLTLPLFVLALDASVLFLAAPHIGADLAPDANQWLWIMDVYGFMIAGFLITMGAVGDRIGRRRLLLLGSAAFALASLWAALADSPIALIAARAVLGVAGATLMPSTLALIRTMFRDDRQRTTAVAVWMTTFSVGVALGPLIGGALLEVLPWGSVFLLALPAIVPVVLLGRMLLPESRDPAPARTDLPGAALSVIAMISLVYGLKELVAQGPEPAGAIALLLGLAAGTVFVRRLRRVPAPLVDPALFASRALRTALVLLLLGVFSATAVNFLVPSFLQASAGAGPLVAGLLTAPVAVAAIGGSLAAPAMAGRWGPLPVIAGGAVLSLAGHLVLAQAAAGGPVWALVAGGALAVLGVSPTTVLGTDLVVSSAPEERAGSAAALSETGGELGVALGIAVMGGLASAVYRFRVESLLPAEVDPATAAAVAENAVSAERAVSGLPPDTAGAVLTAAGEAFASGVSAAGYACAAVALLLAGLAVRSARTRR
ncbi:MFS transporter [Nocardiopsis sp. NPDC057823]|uniref:MFS transporter n=1 Tax=Nocardiopsis sp. NPDC057823 TaxID=3346256 RepID=UPI00367076FD